MGWTDVLALKMHSGDPKVFAGKSLDTAFKGENLMLLCAGMPNLGRHIRNAVACVPDTALQAFASAAVKSTGRADGGAGVKALTQAVSEACELPRSFKVLYEASANIESKILSNARG